MFIEYILFRKHASENMIEKHINIERFITGAPKAHFMGLDMVSPGRMEWLKPSPELTENFS